MHYFEDRIGSGRFGSGRKMPRSKSNSLSLFLKEPGLESAEAEAEERGTTVSIGIEIEIEIGNGAVQGEKESVEIEVVIVGPVLVVTCVDWSVYFFGFFERREGKEKKRGLKWYDREGPRTPDPGCG